MSRIAPSRYFLVFFGFFLLLFRMECAHASSAEGADFLKMGVGARYLGLGEVASSAMVDDANALYWDPSRLSRVRGVSVSLVYASYFDTLRHQYLSLARNGRVFGTVGLFAQTLLIGDFSQTDNVGSLSSNKVTPQDSAFGVGWGRTYFGTMPVGITAKYIRSKILNSAKAMAVDVGSGFDFKKASFSISAHNMGGKLKYETEETSLPFYVGLSGSFRMTDFLTFGTGGYLMREHRTLGVGAEYQALLSEKNHLFLRTGYNNRSQEVPGFQGSSFGIGFRRGFFDIDYALVPFGDLGQTHHMSLTFRFSEPKFTPVKKTITTFSPPDEVVEVSSPTEMKELRPKEADLLFRKGAEDSSVSLTETEGFKIQHHVLFDFGSSSLAPLAEVPLEEARDFLLKHPRYFLRVSGHTDSSGSNELNKTISVLRAESVASYLAERWGLPRNRFIVDGLGEENPAASNETSEGRRLNRRVELYIVSNLRNGR